MTKIKVNNEIVEISTQVQVWTSTFLSKMEDKYGESDATTLLREIDAFVLEALKDESEEIRSIFKIYFSCLITLLELENIYDHDGEDKIASSISITMKAIIQNSVGAIFHQRQQKENS